MITCLNMFPYKNGISRYLSPAAIILGSPNPDYIKLKITFGSYAQIYIGTKNVIKHRMVGFISLILDEEWGGGGGCFMYLATGKYIHNCIFT